MTLLGGLFSKKQKSKQRDAQLASASSPEDPELVSWSPTDSYVTPDTHGPSVPNGKSYLHPDSARDPRANLNAHHSSLDTMPSSSTSRLRLPFGRKKSSRVLPSGVASAPEEDPQLGSSPRPPYMGRTSTSSTNAASEAEASSRLRPPPSKSAIFAAYTDPNSALSTRSLPHDGNNIHSELSAETLPHAPRRPKRPSLFAWTKSTPNKIPVLPKDEAPASSPVTSTDHGDSSFNLKSFRHVGSSSQTRSNASNTSLSAPIPRPRGDSVHSDSSQQRISVAAFREAQARRSMAGSPSPSNRRSPSPLPPSPAVAYDTDRGRSGPRPSRSSPHIPQTAASSPTNSYHQNQMPLQQWRKSGMSFAATSMYASDSDESQESEEGEEESDNDRAYGGLMRRGTVKSSRPLAGKDRTAKARAKSELGHGTSSFSAPFTRKDNSNGNVLPSGSSKSHLGHGNGYTTAPDHSRAPPLPHQFLASPPPSSSNPYNLSQSQSSLSGEYGGGSRPRASNSASALTPSAAAKRASIVAAANAANDADAVMQYKRASRHVRDSSIHSNPGEPPSMTTAKKAATHLGHGDYPSSNSRPQQQQPQIIKMAAAMSDSDSDSDNAPLATLVPPRRPGSAMSSYSTGNASARSVGGTPVHKPLIDIKELMGGTGAANKSGSAPTIGNSAGKSMEGFIGGRTLLGELGSGGSPGGGPGPGQSRKMSTSSVPASSLSSSSSPPTVESPVLASLNPAQRHVMSKTAPFNFVSPPGTPAREEVKTLGGGSGGVPRPAPRSVTMPVVLGSAGRESSPEMTRRDALTERLSRVVKKTVDGHTSNSNTPTSTTTTTTSSSANAASSSSPLALRARTTSPEPMSASPPPALKERAASPVFSRPQMPAAAPATGSRSNTPTSFSKGRRMSMGEMVPMEVTSSPTPASPPRPAATPQPRQTQQMHRQQQQQQPQINSEPSPPDQSLADLLGAGIRLISFTGESDETDSSDSSDEGSDESEDNYGYDSVAARRIRDAKQGGVGATGGGAGETGSVGRQAQPPLQNSSQNGYGNGGEQDGEERERQGKITPIPIKQRTPLPAFSVTSRPQFPRRPDMQQQGSGMSSGASSASGGSGNGAVGGTRSQRDSAASTYSLFGVSANANPSGGANANARKRSSTLIPTLTTASTLAAPSQANSSTSNLSSSAGAGNTPSTNLTLQSHRAQNSASGSNSSSSGDNRTSALRALGATGAMQPPRQRSSTMLPMMPSQPPSSSGPNVGVSGSNTSGLSQQLQQQQQNIHKPFAMRRDSPASSTGDSSSGRAPLTPRDGSDIVMKGGERDSRGGRLVDVDQYSGGASGLGINTRAKGKQIKRRSVSFEDDMRDLAGSGPERGNGSGGERGSGGGGARNSREFLAKGEVVPAVKRTYEHQLEERRKERRREEAKAAIELGNVINGRGPVVDDDEDDMPINQVNQRMSTMNPMMMSPMGMQPQQLMGYGPGPQGPMPPGGPWGMGMGMGMNMPMNVNPANGLLSPTQFMVPPPNANDANFLVAHQQAMMYAKQAYQMAVAQQAMAAAADEWERSSNVGGMGSVYGGSNGAPSMLGAPSPMMMPQFGMMGQMGGMGMMGGGGGGNNWSTQSGIFPSSRSMYNANMSSSRSDYGGGMNTPGGLTPNWSSTRSSYGDLGPSTTNGGRGQRDSTYGQNPSAPPPCGKTNPRMRTTSSPVSPPPNRNSVVSAGPTRRAPPPSSWKQGF